MPPASLVRKVTEYEISESQKTKKRTKSKQPKGSAKKKAPKSKQKKLQTPRTVKSASARSKAKSTKKVASSSRGKSASKPSTTRATPTNSARSLPSGTINSEVAADTIHVKLNCFEVRIESSPNGRAKCQCCGQKIEKHQRRVGICRKNIRYYHVNCLPESVRKQIPPQIFQQRREQQKDPVVLQRSGLFSKLKLKYSGVLSEAWMNRLAISLPRNQAELSRIIGQNPNYDDVKKDIVRDIRSFVDAIISQRSELLSELKLKYDSLPEESIKNLVIALPRNETELLKIVGDFYARYDNFLKDILRDIRKFVGPTPNPQSRGFVERTRIQAAAGTQNSGRSRPANSSPEVIVIDDSDEEDGDDTAHNNTMQTQNTCDNDSSDDEDDEILLEETLTCAQVVQQKFDRAAANGEIVDID